MAISDLGCVAIGRNEGQRLVRCLESLVGRAAHVALAQRRERHVHGFAARGPVDEAEQLVRNAFHRRDDDAHVVPLARNDARNATNIHTTTSAARCSVARFTVD